jgi:hypothetical protein
MTQAPLPSPSTTCRRRATREREFRRIRILAMAPAGWSYAAIGREEAISRERVRQIVAKALVEAGETETKLVHARAPVARLEPTLRLAARSVAEGDLAAIDRLLRVLDRCAAIDVADAADNAGGRERRLAKLNAMAENIKRRRELHATRRRSTKTRQPPKPPLTRRKPLMRKGYTLDKACRGLTLLDKT